MVATRDSKSIYKGLDKWIPILYIICIQERKIKMSKIPLSRKKCIDCGKIGVVERKRCGECAKEYNRQRVKKRYEERGHTFTLSTCAVCKQPMKAWRKNQIAHTGCRHKVVEDYNKIPRLKGKTVGRQVVLSLGISIPKDWVVHHSDENPYNNIPSNLVLMSRKAHNSLHRFLQNQRSLYLKKHSSISEDCWNTLRDHLTTAWLATTSAKVIKIDDIGQSAAELLAKEEGSEAMHGTPNGSNTYGDDMVQTTTKEISVSES